MEDSENESNITPMGPEESASDDESDSDSSFSEFDNGYVFLCNNNTEKECLRLNLFGTNRKDLKRVISSLTERTAIFLLNFQRKVMMGVWVKHSEPSTIKRNAFGGKFPLQIQVVRVNFYQSSNWAISNNRYDPTRKLSKKRTKEMISLLKASKPVARPSSQRKRYNPYQQQPKQQKSQISKISMQPEPSPPKDKEMDENPQQAARSRPLPDCNANPKQNENKIMLSQPHKQDALPPNEKEIALPPNQKQNALPPNPKRDARPPNSKKDAEPPNLPPNQLPPIENINEEESLEQILRSNRLGKYVGIFQEHEVEVPDLCKLDDRDLAFLIPKIGPRARLKDYIRSNFATVAFSSQPIS